MDGASATLAVILAVAFLLLLTVSLVGAVAVYKGDVAKAAPAAVADEAVLYHSGKAGLVGDINQANLSNYMYDLEQQSSIQALQSELKTFKATFGGSNAVSRFESEPPGGWPPSASDSDPSLAFLSPVDAPAAVFAPAVAPRGGGGTEDPFDGGVQGLTEPVLSEGALFGAAELADQAQHRRASVA